MTTGRCLNSFLLLTGMAVSAAAQVPPDADEIPDSSSHLGLYFMIFIVLAGLGAAYLFWRRSRQGIEQPLVKDENRYRNYYRNESFELEQVDVDAAEELEWLRKAKQSAATQAQKYVQKRAVTPRPRSLPVGQAEEMNFDTRMFQEKMKMLQYAQLPINSFNELSPAKKYEPLPVSNDKGLLTAIEQAHVEDEDDEAVRELAVRILAAFRTENSVEALSQIALYDLSSNLRSRAVSILTDFDHESVFETILLACADPTREVRAAAARGLFRLNFDRADAWKRLIETRDEFRMSHAVRAAVEADIVQKSFDRLVHEDVKIAYEAYCLVALMICSGEDREIFEAIRSHKDERVKYALLHVVKMMGDPRSLVGLNSLQVTDGLSDDVVKRINDAMAGYQQVAWQVDAPASIDYVNTSA